MNNQYTLMTFNALQDFICDKDTLSVSQAIEHACDAGYFYHTFVQRCNEHLIKYIHDKRTHANNYIDFTQMLHQGVVSSLDEFVCNWFPIEQRVLSVSQFWEYHLTDEQKLTYLIQYQDTSKRLGVIRGIAALHNARNHRHTLCDFRTIKNILESNIDHQE